MDERPTLCLYIGFVDGRIPVWIGDNGCGLLDVFTSKKAAHLCYEDVRLVEIREAPKSLKPSRLKRGQP